MDTSPVLTPAAPILTSPPATRTWTASLFVRASGIAATTALLVSPVMSIRSLSESTMPPLFQPAALVSSIGKPARGQPPRTTATMVQQLHTKSGLTWEQVGRLLGVSRQAVHLWARGGRVNNRHIELLAQLGSIVDDLPAGDPAGRRTLLFAPRQGVPSIFDGFLRRLASAEGVVSGTPFAPHELLSARYDEAESG